MGTGACVEVRSGTEKIQLHFKHRCRLPGQQDRVDPCVSTGQSIMPALEDIMNRLSISAHGYLKLTDNNGFHCRVLARVKLKSESRFGCFYQDTSLVEGEFMGGILPTLL